MLIREIRVKPAAFPNFSFSAFQHFRFCLLQTFSFCLEWFVLIREIRVKPAAFPDFSFSAFQLFSISAFVLSDFSFQLSAFVFCLTPPLLKVYGSVYA